MPSMNFWRAEVEAGKVITVTDAECTITVTHITLDKGRDEGSVVLYARVNGMRTQVIGTLSQKVPQMKCKLIFPHEFSLSHSHQSACVHFLGSYKDHNSDSGNDETDTDDSPDNLANYEQKEEVKKGGHTSTPHRAKKGGNSPMNANQSPKSGGQSSGGNKKQFNSGGKQFGSNSKGKKRKGKGRA